MSVSGADRADGQLVAEGRDGGGRAAGGAEGGEQSVAHVRRQYCRQQSEMSGVYVPLFVDKWLDDPIRGPTGKLINFKGFAVGDGFPACIPMAGRPIDWCVDLNNGTRPAAHMSHTQTACAPNA